MVQPVRARIGIGGVRSRVKRGFRQAGERVTDALDPLRKRGEREAARDLPVAKPERPKIEDGPLNGKH